MGRLVKEAVAAANSSLLIAVLPSNSNRSTTIFSGTFPGIAGGVGGIEDGDSSNSSGGGSGVGSGGAIGSWDGGLVRSGCLVGKSCGSGTGLFWTLGKGRVAGGTDGICAT